jgi:hypothetical protein
MAIAMHLTVTKAEYSFVCRNGDVLVAQGNSTAEAVGNFVLRYQDLFGLTIEADESARLAERVRRSNPA